MKIVERKITDLKDADYNPRKLFKHQEKTIRDSLAKFGFVDPIIVNMHASRKNVIIGGHQRRKVWAKMGHKTIPCVEVDLPLEKERELNIRLNQNTGEWDWELLDSQFEMDDLLDWGFELDDFEPIKVEGLTDPDDVPDAPESPTTRLGDLYVLGDHRLLCGDSTNHKDVEKLLNGQKPLLMVTDPPYGVNYDPNWRNEADRANGKPYGARAIGRVQNDDKIDWSGAWALSPCKVAYVWHAGKYAGDVQESLEKNDFIIISQIIWAKPRFVISRGDYHWQHEPCWYAHKKGSKHFYIGDRSQTTLWEISHVKSETGHGTQKPIECMERPIRNNEGDVYDPFLGSGTTLIAAEQQGRKCYGLEIDPIYCDVIVKRWEDFTGKTAVLQK